MGARRVGKPAQPGNRLAVKHGAHAEPEPLRVNDKVRALYDVLAAADELAADPKLAFPQLDADPNEPSDDVLLRPTSKGSLSPQALVRHNLHLQDKGRVAILLIILLGLKPM